MAIPFTRRSWLGPALAAALLLSAADTLNAQWLDTAKPWRPYYGYPTDQFVIIGTPSKWKGSYDNPVPTGDSLWAFAHSMGISVIFWKDEPWFLGELVKRSATLRRYDRATNAPEGDTDRVLTNPTTDFHGPFGRAIQFYPFDSAQSPYHIWRFNSRSGGVIYSNRDERGASEQHYTPANTTPGDTILKDVYYRYLADTLNPIHFFSRNLLTLRKQMQPDTMFTFAVKGHLIDTLNESIPDSAAVFTVRIYHRISAREWYLDNNYVRFDSAYADTLVLIDTFNVTKAQLTVGYPDSVVLSKYRTAEYTTSMYTRRIDGGPGPIHAGQPAGNASRVEVRIIWTGAEKAALRQLEIRDSLAQLMLSNGNQGKTYRDSLLHVSRQTGGARSASRRSRIHSAGARRSDFRFRGPTSSRSASPMNPASRWRACWTARGSTRGDSL